ncbi:MAG TPA: chromate efflux transporter [Hyphomicrobiaceae bacterium]|nr:chromate efflux transporter [Hyphomicrobiaceae bacterium]
MSTTDSGATPTYAEAFRVWLKIGILSFGGPAGQIAMMHRELVQERRWIDEQRYLNALNFCMLLPGPEATQLATYVGWRLHGVIGGITAGLLFVLPGAILMLLLSLLYVVYGKVPIGEALFVGIKAAVLAIVVEALLRIARRGLKGSADKWIAGLAFVAIFFLAIPFPAIVAAAAIFGFWRARGAPASAAAAPVSVPLSRTFRTALLWLAIWIVPLVAVAMIFGKTHVLSQLAWYFSYLACFTFGGAYAVLAWMADDAVRYYGWLSPGQMIDGLGLAETTPGPLILVTQFVGFLAGYQAAGHGPALVLAVAGALVTLWATFAPCYLWIFVGAPYVERLSAEPRLKSALAAVTAAVVGVILYLTVWFALHVLFKIVREPSIAAGPLKLRAFVPDGATADVRAVILAAAAFVLVFALHRSLIATLAACGGAALAWHWIG